MWGCFCQPALLRDARYLWRKASLITLGEVHWAPSSRRQWAESHDWSSGWEYWSSPRRPHPVSVSSAVLQKFFSFLAQKLKVDFKLRGGGDLERPRALTHAHTLSTRKHCRSDMFYRERAAAPSPRCWREKKSIEQETKKKRSRPRQKSSRAYEFPWIPRWAETLLNISCFI